MKKALFILLASLVFASWAQAFEVKMSGQVEAYGSFFLQGDKGKENNFLEMRYLQKLTFIANDNWLFHLETDMRADNRNFSHGAVNGITENDSRWMLGYREAYTEYQKDKLRIRIGKQIINWSVTDTISPSDNISPRDYMEIVRWERIGVPAINIRYGGDTFIEGIYTPFFTPSKLPKLGGRWDRDLPVGLRSVEQDVPGKDRGQFALRVGTNFKGFDLTASYFNGYSYSPSYRLERDGQMTDVIPFYVPLEAYTIGAAKSWKGFTFRGEVGYFQQNGDDNFIQYVIGADREFTGLVGKTDSFYFLLQYANEIKTRSKNELPFDTIDFRRVFNNAIMAKAKYAPSDSSRWEYKLEGTYNFTDHDIYVQPAAAWKYKSFQVEGGLNMFFGPSSTFFGGYKKNDHLYLKTTYNF